MKVSVTAGVVSSLQVNVRRNKRERTTVLHQVNAGLTIFIFIMILREGINISILQMGKASHKVVK